MFCTEFPIFLAFNSIHGVKKIYVKLWENLDIIFDFTTYFFRILIKKFQIFKLYPQRFKKIVWANIYFIFVWSNDFFFETIF